MEMYMTDRGGIKGYRRPLSMVVLGSKPSYVPPIGSSIIYDGVKYQVKDVIWNWDDDEIEIIVEQSMF